MRFAFISPEGTALSLMLRLLDEGEEVRAYIIPRQQRFVGDNLIDKATSYEDIVAWGKEAPSVFVFDSTAQGEKAESLRRAGALVVGGGVFCDRLEKDRAWSERLVKSMGVRVPVTHEFSDIDATVAWLKKQKPDARFYFKTNRYLEGSATYGGPAYSLVRHLANVKRRFGGNISNLVQEHIDGVALSTAAWWNGTTFLEPFLGTIEHKKFMDCEIGASTGCSFNLVWPYPGYPKLARALKFDAVADIFRVKEAPPGIYDMNALIREDDRTPYFLEWTPRFGYDSEPTALRGLTMPLGEFLYGLATATLSEAPFDDRKAQMSVRLSVPPYDWEHVDDLKASAFGVPIDGVGDIRDPDNMFVPYGVALDDNGEPIVADLAGLVGLVAASGTNVRKMGKEILDFIEKIQIPNLQYRTDAAECIADDMEKLEQLGYGVKEVVRDGAESRGFA